MDAHKNSLQQLDLYWIGTSLHSVCKAAVVENFKSVAKASEVGLGENVVSVVEIVVIGDADGFGKLAWETDFNCLPSSYNLVSQLKGVDRILENDIITFILYLRQTKEKQLVAVRIMNNGRDVVLFSVSSRNILLVATYSNWLILQTQILLFINEKKHFYLQRNVNVSPNLNFCPTSAEGHCTHDVSAVGGERAWRVTQLEKVLVNARHGSFIKGYCHLIGWAMNSGLACKQHNLY